MRSTAAVASAVARAAPTRACASAPRGCLAPAAWAPVRRASSYSASDDAAFARVVHARHSCRRFDAARGVPDDVMARILALTLVRVARADAGCAADAGGGRRHSPCRKV